MLYTVIYPVLISSSLPPAFVAVRLISYFPVANANEGFCVVANCVQLPVVLLYAHLHDVGLLVELSVNTTVSGVFPEVGVPVKPATGGATKILTLTGFVALLLPPAFDTVRFAVYEPATV
jgi:hypothetical protein